jgi:hypothetical protein
MPPACMAMRPVWEDHRHRINHVQIAGFPARNEPGGGGFSLPDLCDADRRALPVNLDRRRIPPGEGPHKALLACRAQIAWRTDRRLTGSMRDARLPPSSGTRPRRHGRVPPHRPCKAPRQAKPERVFGKGHHLHLIDGSAYIFRAYHALPPLTRKSDGLPVGAVAGFCNILWNEISRENAPGPRPISR